MPACQHPWRTHRTSLSKYLFTCVAVQRRRNLPQKHSCIQLINTERKHHNKIALQAAPFVYSTHISSYTRRLKRTTSPLQPSPAADAVQQPRKGARHHNTYTACIANSTKQQPRGSPRRGPDLCHKNSSRMILPNFVNTFSTMYLHGSAKTKQMHNHKQYHEIASARQDAQRTHSVTRQSKT